MLDDFLFLNSRKGKNSGNLHPSYGINCQGPALNARYVYYGDLPR